MRIKNPFNGFKYAIEGVVHVFRTQRHMKFHFLTMVLVLLISLVFKLQREEILILMFTITLVLVAEMFNTALEAITDLVTTSYHPLAKFAKDIAAGAVLLTTLNALVVGTLLFFGGGKWHLLSKQVKIKSPDPLTIALVGMVLMISAILIWKVSGGKGSLLHGGVVSGHTAIGFFFAITIFYLSGRLAAAIVAFLMAILIAQSRVEARIHTVKEVIMGAILGSGVTVLIYYLAGSHLPWPK